MPTLALPNPFRGLVSLFYPPFCAVCARSRSGRTKVSARVARRRRRGFGRHFARNVRNLSPGRSRARLPAQIARIASCISKRRFPPTEVAAWCAKWFTDFKYGRQIHLRHLLGRWLAETLDDPRLAGRRFDLVVPVPLHPARQRERGFNQAELLAAALQRSSGLRCPQRSATDALHRHADAIRPE